MACSPNFKGDQYFVEAASCRPHAGSDLRLKEATDPAWRGPGARGAAM